MSSGISRILLNECKWIPESYGLGYYIFEIRINMRSNSYIIKRRYTDLERLNNHFINTAKGCRLPILPEKNIWINFSLHNNSIIEDRKLQIQEFIDFIINHKKLSLNPYFEKFIANDSIFTKEDANNKDSNFLSKVISYLPSNLLFNTKKNSIISEKDFIYNINDKLYFQRFSKGLKEVITQFEEYLKINLNKTDSIHKIKTYSLAISKFSETKFKAKDSLVVVVVSLKGNIFISSFSFEEK